MMTLLLHTAPAAHTHPDQMVVAVLFAIAFVAASWMLERRRS